MSCPAITTIFREECIGNSLTTINSNFSAIQAAICDPVNGLSDKVDSLITTRNTIGTLYANLSGPATQGAAKAWVKFDGLRGNADSAGGPFTPAGYRFVYSKFNIGDPTVLDDTGVQVNLEATGDYIISFKPGLFTTGNYGVIGTSSEAVVDGKYTWLQPVEYNASYLRVKVLTYDGSLAAARHISVVIF
jgi:hypothetical protein